MIDYNDTLTQCGILPEWYEDCDPARFVGDAASGGVSFATLLVHAANYGYGEGYDTDAYWWRLAEIERRAEHLTPHEISALICVAANSGGAGGWRNARENAASRCL